MNEPFKPITPKSWTWARQAHYSQAVKVGDLVLTCGVAPFDGEGNLVGGDDFRTQCQQVVTNLTMLLDEAGSSFDRIVRQHVYLKRREDLVAFRDLRAEIYTQPYPASVLVVVTEHAHPDMLVEIACEALRR